MRLDHLLSKEQSLRASSDPLDEETQAKAELDVVFGAPARAVLKEPKRLFLVSGLFDNHIASVGIFIHAKLGRAYGGCLGARRRGRTWLAAISLGELPSKL